MRVGFFFVLENIVFDLSQIIFFIIGCFATITLVMMVYPDLFRRKQKFYAKHVITPFERKMFIRLKEAFPRHHVLAQVSFSSLITSEHYKIRAKFNRKVTDFVLLDEQLAVVVIMKLGKIPTSAKNKKMQNVMPCSMKQVTLFCVLQKFQVFANCTNTLVSRLQCVLKLL